MSSGILGKLKDKCEALRVDMKKALYDKGKKKDGEDKDRMITELANKQLEENAANAAAVAPAPGPAAAPAEPAAVDKHGLLKHQIYFLQSQGKKLIDGGWYSNGGAFKFSEDSF